MVHPAVITTMVIVSVALLTILASSISTVLTSSAGHKDDSSDRRSQRQAEREPRRPTGHERQHSASRPRKRRESRRPTGVGRQDQSTAARAQIPCRSKSSKLSCMIIPSYGDCPPRSVKKRMPGTFLQGVGKDLEIIQELISKDKSLDLAVVYPSVCECQIPIDECKRKIREKMITTQQMKNRSGRKSTVINTQWLEVRLPDTVSSARGPAKHPVSHIYGM